MVKWIARKVFLEEFVYARLEYEGVVDRHHPDVVFLVPTRLAPTGHTTVHNVIRHKKISLKNILCGYFGWKSPELKHYRFQLL